MKLSKKMNEPMQKRKENQKKERKKERKSVKRKIGLVSLFNGISTLFRLFNAKAILLEEQ